MAPGDAAIIDACDLIGAGDDIQWWVPTRACFLQSGSCAGDAQATDLFVYTMLNACMSAPCDGTPAVFCMPVPGLNQAKSILPLDPPIPGQGQGELGKAWVWQGSLQGQPYPTVRFNASWVVSQGGIETAHPACEWDYSECGNISFNARRVKLADFKVPMSSQSQCIGEVENLVRLCVSPPTDLPSGNNFNKISHLVGSSAPTPCKSPTPY